LQQSLLTESTLVGYSAAYGEARNVITFRLPEQETLMKEKHRTEEVAARITAKLLKGHSKLVRAISTEVALFYECSLHLKLHRQL